MKRTVLLLTVVFLIFAIGVIAVECYPLMITPRNDAESNALDTYLKTSDYQTGDFKIYIPDGKADHPEQFKSLGASYPGVSGAQAGGVVAIVGVAGILLNASMQEGDSEGSQVELGKRSSEVLINEIPEITGDLLNASGVRNVSMINGYVQLPITDRSLDPSLSNWLQPLSSFMKSDSSAIDYSTIDGDSYDTVIEVGIINNEFYDRYFRLQVFMKVIDAETSQVIASTRRIEFFPKKQNLETLLENDAKGLKQLSRNTAKKLLSECLVEVGLISKQ
jgi:hypothetical protein